MRVALIVAAAIAGVLVLWLAGARPLVLLLDQVATEGEAKPTAGPFTASWGWMSVGATPFELAGPAAEPGKLRIMADAAGRVAFHEGAKTFPLGVRRGAADDPMPIETPFAPDPGDSVSLRVAHSAVAWPTPLELNFMTGKSPSWKRNVYYTLAWAKADGAKLTLTWRYEQWYYDDWGSPQMTREGATGLISVQMDGMQAP